MNIQQSVSICRDNYARMSCGNRNSLDYGKSQPETATFIQLFIDERQQCVMGGR